MVIGVCGGMVVPVPCIRKGNPDRPASIEAAVAVAEPSPLSPATAPSRVWRSLVGTNDAVVAVIVVMMVMAIVMVPHMMMAVMPMIHLRLGGRDRDESKYGGDETEKQFAHDALD
jgi:hypothetical protein